MSLQKTQKNANNLLVTPHLAFLDGIRALCALYVVWHHMFVQIWPRGTMPPAFGGGWWLTFWLIYGNYAVDIFIVVSGFCLALPIIKNGDIKGGILTFYKRRCRRILPPYYASLLICLVLIFTIIGKPTGTHWDVSVDVTPLGTFICGLLLQDYFPVIFSDQINHVFWSIAVEWHIYLFFPFVVWLWSKIGVGKTTVFSAIITLPIFWLLKKSVYQSIAPHFLFLFSLGALGAFIAFGEAQSWQKLRRLPWLGILGGMIALISSILIVLIRRFHGDVLNQMGQLPKFDTLVGIATMALLVSLSRATQNAKPSPLLRCFTWKPLVFLGSFSYSIYLMHAPLIQVFWQYTIYPLHLSKLTQLGLLALPTTLGVLVLCYGFYWLFERPFCRQPRQGLQSPKISEANAPQVIGELFFSSSSHER
jgi:peptidoglycan/LPS O-acetylase OafA/YrhL